MQAAEPLDVFAEQGLDDVLALPCPGDDGREVEDDMDCALVASELGVLSKVNPAPQPVRSLAQQQNMSHRSGSWKDWPTLAC